MIRRNAGSLHRWLVLTGCFSASLIAQTPKQKDLPHLQRNGSVTQLVVDGKPMILFAGELHNSSPSSPQYMRPIWDKLQAAHLNGVIGAASWELVEPEEGHFNFDAVDDQVRQAKTHGMRLVLIWFGSFKNASYTYTPLWVKRDPQRFPLAQTQPKQRGVLRTANTLSVFNTASEAADAKAFAALMAHLRATDTAHTVVMIQMENETGLRNDSRDRSAAAETAYKTEVPQELTNWLKTHRETLLPELRTVWEAAGAHTTGNWPEVFGKGPFGDEVFMAWYTARYLQMVADAGARELPLPIYANAWLVQFENQTPGDYPSGGPVSRMMDVWKLAAPRLALLAPDIYLGDFDGVCASYTRSGNPLFIPEARTSTANLFIAVGKYNTLGYSPFGIDGINDDLLSSAYQALESIVGPLTVAQARGAVQLIPPAPGGEIDLNIGSYTAHVERGIHGSPPKPGKITATVSPIQDLPPAPGETVKPRLAAPFVPVVQRHGYLHPFDDARRGVGLIVPDGPDSFYIVGTGLAITFSTTHPGRIARIGTADEGLSTDGPWKPGRRLNGDETAANYRLTLDPDSVRVVHVVLYTSPQ